MEGLDLPLSPDQIAARLQPPARDEYHRLRREVNAIEQRFEQRIGPAHVVISHQPPVTHVLEKKRGRE